MLSDGIEVRNGPSGLRGLFAVKAFASGDVIWWLDPSDDLVPYTLADVAAIEDAHVREELYSHMFQTGPATWLASAWYRHPDASSTPSIDASLYMNHSCDANAVYADSTGARMIARRPIAAGEEISFDYATSELTDEGDAWQCQCGSDVCRGSITGRDALLPAVQERYRGHFLQHVLDFVAQQQNTP